MGISQKDLLVSGLVVVSQNVLLNLNLKKISRMYNMYQITKYSFNQAKKLGVIIEPSKLKNKKIDIYKDGKKISSIGGVKKDGSYYKDYPTYLKTEGKEKAEKRKTAFKKRHEKNRKKIGTNAYYADRLLW